MPRTGLIIFLLVTGLAAAPAQTQDVVLVSLAQCRQVVAHQPADDVVYQPGVDAAGRPVAPADLAGPGTVQTPNFVTIALDLPLREFLGADTPPFTGKAEVLVGTVDYDIRTARLSYNGQPLSDPAAHAIAAACARQLKSRTRP